MIVRLKHALHICFCYKNPIYGLQFSAMFLVGIISFRFRKGLMSVCVHFHFQPFNSSSTYSIRVIFPLAVFSLRFCFICTLDFVVNAFTQAKRYHLNETPLIVSKMCKYLVSLTSTPCINGSFWLKIFRPLFRRFFFLSLCLSFLLNNHLQTSSVRIISI